MAEICCLVFRDTHCALRALETFHPSTFYLPPEDCDVSLLEAASCNSFCEWKGKAGYFDLVHELRSFMEQRRKRAVWQYREPHRMPQLTHSPAIF